MSRPKGHTVTGWREWKVTLIIRTLATALCLLALAACTPGASAPTQPLGAGSKLTIKSKGELYFAKVTGHKGPIVVMEATNWKNEYLYKSHYYRGLLLISRDEEDYGWRLDVDLTPLEELFPMEVGKVAELSGSVVNNKNERTDSYEARIEILDKIPLLLPSGSQTVYKVKMVQSYTWEDGSKEWAQIVYHAPDLAVNLKGAFTNKKGKQEYWRVTEVKRADDTQPAIPTRQRRRSGTVMI